MYTHFSMLMNLCNDRILEKLHVPGTDNHEVSFFRHVNYVNIGKLPVL